MEELGAFLKNVMVISLVLFVLIIITLLGDHVHSSFTCCLLDFTIVGADFPVAAFVHVFQDVAAGLEVVKM